MDPRPTFPHPAPDLPGYRDVSLISSGGTSLVYRAVQTRLSRTVAIKVLLVDGDTTTQAQYQRELETTVLLSSQPHIVGIIDTGVTATGHPYIVMEYCPGGSYGQILKQRGPLPVDEVIEVGAKIAEALQAAHDVGVLHRDVKPSNILRSAFGPALADFGIARAPHQLEGTDALDRMTPFHASPEAMRKDRQSPVSDLYSLASTLWHLLAGRPPFADPARPLRDLEELRTRVLTEQAPLVPRPDVPDWLQRELARALAKDPGGRQPSAHTFAEILRYHAHSPQPAFPTAPAPPTTPVPQPHIPQPSPPQPAPVTAPREAFRWPASAPTRRSEYLSEPELTPDALAPELVAASTITWSGDPVAAPAVEPGDPAAPSTVDDTTPPEDSPAPYAPGHDAAALDTSVPEASIPSASAVSAALAAPTEVQPVLGPLPALPPALTAPPSPPPPSFTTPPQPTFTPPRLPQPTFTPPPQFTARPPVPATARGSAEAITRRMDEESWREPGRPRRSGTVLAIVSASIAAVLVIAVVIVALLSRPGRQLAGPVPSGTQTLKVVSQGAPTDVKLVDNLTSITISWTVPGGGTLTTVILGGQAANQPQLLTTLDPGTTTWTQDGLNEAYDYCYVVAVVYRADGNDVSARSPMVCTHRHG
jgi:serine/threonine protein kinase